MFPPPLWRQCVCLVFFGPLFLRPPPTIAAACVLLSPFTVRKQTDQVGSSQHVSQSQRSNEGFRKTSRGQELGFINGTGAFRVAH
mmetsp:Transcript_16877/g.49134  ORF Transcript_16877/g.49134 Transcript_16877/m.49134 type:complete len:85 (-) Transcript_16877:1982-2236(-)